MRHDETDVETMPPLSWVRCGQDNVRILAHFRIPALMEKDMGRAGYDFQSPDNEKP